MITELSVAIPLAVISVFVSAFCSGSEVALFSLRRVDREHLAKSDRFTDRRVIKLLERPRRLIATVLIGNEAFNSVLAILALGVVMRMCAGASLWGIGAITLGVTLPLVVMITEVTSKTLAAKAPLTWSRMAVLPLSLLMLLVSPIRILVQAAASVLLAPFGEAARSGPNRDLSEEEFRSLLDAGSAQGQVDARERRLIHRVFEFSDKNVGQVMTPRERMFALSYDLSVQRLVKEVAARGFSRVPIYQKSLDNIRGILNAKDLVRALAGQGLGRPLGDILHEPLFVPRTTPVKRLFLTFKQKKVHMAIVVSEYGKVLGIVTMDDVLAQIFGQLRDERAELQSSIPGRRARTPVAGVPIRPSGIDSGPVPRDGQEVSHAVVRADGSDLSEPITKVENEPLLRPDSSPAAESEVLDPPPVPRLIHPVDEVTPPAIDLNELLREHRDAAGRGRKS